LVNFGRVCPASRHFFKSADLKIKKIFRSANLKKTHHAWRGPNLPKVFKKIVKPAEKML
jgi:hypothetical protein